MTDDDKSGQQVAQEIADEFGEWLKMSRRRWGRPDFIIDMVIKVGQLVKKHGAV